jgi:hypothetical protein
VSYCNIKTHLSSFIKFYDPITLNQTNTTIKKESRSFLKKVNSSKESFEVFTSQKLKNSMSIKVEHEGIHTPLYRPIKNR